MDVKVKSEQRAVTTYVDEYTLVLTLSLEETQELYKLLEDDDRPVALLDRLYMELGSTLDNIGRTPV